MEEAYVSGYCRQLDGSRVVEAILENGKLTEVDCLYGQCIYQENCPVAAELRSRETPGNA